MRITRFFWFLVSIFIGASLGLLYGWMINPVRYVDTLPDTLRADYKADYVLMVAEVYQAEGNIDLAANRLLLLGVDPPLRTVQRAILSAQDLGYSTHDIELLGRLSVALQDWKPGGNQP